MGTLQKQLAPVPLVLCRAITQQVKNGDVMVVASLSMAAWGLETTQGSPCLLPVTSWEAVLSPSWGPLVAETVQHFLFLVVVGA